MALNDNFTSGQTLSTTEMNNLPRGIVAYVSATATQSSVGTSPTDLTSLTSTFTAVATRRYKISAVVNIRNSAGGTDLHYVEIVRGSTVIQTVFISLENNEYATLYPFVVETPGAGSVTYKLRGWSATGSMAVNPLAAADTLSVMVVEDVGST